MKNHILRVLRRELNSFIKEIEMLPEDGYLWKTLPGVTNSIGILANHIIGNLNHFVGSVLGGTDYTRDREKEFLVSSKTREQLIEELKKTDSMLENVFSAIPEENLSEIYPINVFGTNLETGEFLVNICMHTSFHLGQAGYLRRILTGENNSSSVFVNSPIQPKK